MDSLKMIKDLATAFGPSGFEDDVIEVAKKYTPEGYKTRRDSMLNFYLEKEYDPSLPTVLVDAHSDEIGLIVQAVKPDGTLVFSTLGGWVPASLYAQKMVVKNQVGEYVSGVIVAMMHHFGGGNNTNPSIETMTLDIGASSKEEVIEKYKINLGCPVVPATEFEHRNDIMISKAFDCRIGCAAVLETLEMLKDAKVNVNVVGLLSSQEEIGTRGIKVAVNQIKPQVAICFEGTPADDTLVAPHMIQTALGKGPMLRHIDRSMVTNPRFIRMALNIAKEKDIPVQESVRTGGGTNGAVLHTANEGIPTIIIGCPVRYAHSHNSIASFSDYKNSVNLAVEVVKQLDAKTISEF